MSVPFGAAQRRGQRLGEGRRVSAARPGGERGRGRRLQRSGVGLRGRGAGQFSDHRLDALHPADRLGHAHDFTCCSSRCQSVEAISSRADCSARRSAHVDLGVVAGLQLLQADGTGAGGDELLAGGGFLGLGDAREVLQVREHAVGGGPRRRLRPAGMRSWKWARRPRRVRGARRLRGPARSWSASGRGPARWPPGPAGAGGGAGALPVRIRGSCCCSQDRGEVAEPLPGLGVGRGFVHRLLQEGADVAARGSAAASTSGLVPAW